MKIEYITSNRKKYEEAVLILQPWELEQVEMDLPELQGEPEEIIREKAFVALHHHQKPLIVEDVSMFVTALGGLPGPYVKDFLKKLGEQGLSQLVHKFDDHTAYVSCIAAYIAPGEQPHIFEGRQKGIIVTPRGDTRHGSVSWNTIFQPDGFTKTFGELTLEEHSKISMRRIALEKLKLFFESR